MVSSYNAGPGDGPITFVTAERVPEEADAVAVPVLAGLGVANGVGPRPDLDYLHRRAFTGELGQVEPVPTDDGRVLLAVGLGSTPGYESLRRAGAAMANAGGAARTIATTLLAAAPWADERRAAQALAEGVSLGCYRFDAYRKDKRGTRLATVVAVGGEGGAIAEGLRRGAVIAAATRFARDLVNEPPRAMTPQRLAEIASGLASANGLSVAVLDEHAIVEEGLGGLAGVSAGSDEPPRLIKLDYNPPGATGTVAIVGKGITFDSGGLSLKSSDSMTTMKSDMGGAAVVLAAMSLLPKLASPVRVLGFAACTENLPSGRATKPGDVLKIRNGKTIEVLNTDAEGRLVLADALSLAVEAGGNAIIDVATLTSGSIIALGPDIGALMSNDDQLAAIVSCAAEESGEPFWRLPLPAAYRRFIVSEVADLKNVGAPARKAAALTAALLLQEFVGDVPWAHLDIAGPAYRDEADAYLPKGGTGFGVRTLAELLSSNELAAQVAMSWPASAAAATAPSTK